MATSLAVDPTTYVHNPAKMRHGLKYGEHEHKKFDFASHELATEDSPLVIYTHGGAYFTGDLTSLAEADRVITPLRSWLLDHNSYPETASLACSFASVELPQFSHLNSSPGPYNTPYVVTRTGAHGGPGRWCSQARMPEIIEALQEAIQYIKDHANTEGLGKFNPNRIVLAGYSMGALTSLCAAFTPSRPWFGTGQGGGPWDRHSEARVCGVIDYWGEVSTDTRELSYTVSAAAFGRIGVTQEYMDALMLKPDSTGVISVDSEPTELCNQTSPIALIRNSSLRMRRQKILAIYNLQENSFDGAPWNAKNAGGHHYLNKTLLEQACEDASYPSSDPRGIFDPRSTVLDIDGDFSGDVQLGSESMLVDISDFIRRTSGLP